MRKKLPATISDFFSLRPVLLLYCCCCYCYSSYWSLPRRKLRFWGGVKTMSSSHICVSTVHVTLWEPAVKRENTFPILLACISLIFAPKKISETVPCRMLDLSASLSMSSDLQLRKLFCLLFRLWARFEAQLFAILNHQRNGRMRSAHRYSTCRPPSCTQKSKLSARRGGEQT